jgi:GT2 family glycosyltransferase
MPAAGDEVLVSVIVPTYQRGEVLCETLEHILNQSYPHFELIVVDQTSQQPTAVRLKLAELERRSQHLAYIQLPNPGLPGARNEGIRHARGSILLFADDDIVPSEHWIAEHVRNYDDLQVGGVVGRVIEPVEDPVGDGLGRLLGIVGRITFWGRPISNFDSSYRTAIHTARGCNMSFRATVVRQVGLFDERYGGNAQFEETDLSFRVRRLGYTLIYDPLPKVEHLYFASGGCRSADRLSWYRDYLRNKSMFFQKNMPLWTHAPFFLSHILIAMREGLIRAHSIRGFVDLIQTMAQGYRMR